jgi:hypothetical protein
MSSKQHFLARRRAPFASLATSSSSAARGWLLLAAMGAQLACMPRSALDDYSGGGQHDIGGDAGASAVLGTSDSGPADPADAGRGASDPPARVQDGAASSEQATASGGDAVPAEAAGPRVSSSVPANEAVGVRRDTSLSIAFNEPMDRASVEAAFVLGNLPAGTSTFHWDSAGTLLNIVLAAPLEYASGSDPNQLQAQRYEYWLSSAAHDFAGHALPETHLAFSTLRQIQTSVSAEQDPALSGNWRSDGIYGTDSCAPGGASLCIGDSSFGPNASYRGFLSYDLASLAAALEITQAKLEVSVGSVLGSPFAGLGQLGLEHTSFTAITPDAFLASAPPFIASAASVPAGNVLSLDVLAALQADLAGAGSSQYRLRFQTASDGDGSTDLLFLGRASARLRVSYLLP